MSTLNDIWKFRKQISEGIINTVFKNEIVEKVADERMQICKKCEHYDGKCSVPGTGPCCGACGCSLSFKTRSLSSICGKFNIQQEPLWLPVITAKEQEKLDAEQ